MLPVDAGSHVLSGSPSLGTSSTAADLRAQQLLLHLAAAKQHVAETQRLIDEHVADSYSAIGSAVDTTAAHIGSSLAASQDVVRGNVGAVNGVVAKSIDRSLAAAAPHVAAAGLQLDTPEWEKNLYANLPATQAFETAALIGAQQNLDYGTQSQVAQQVINDQAAGMPSSPHLPGPVIPPVPTPAPAPVVPPKVPPVLAPNLDAMPLCGPWINCGQCRMPNGNVVRIGEVPDILPNHLAPRRPNEDEILNCRLAGASAMSWDAVLHSWQCLNPGTKYVCDEPEPPPPPPPEPSPVPTTPPPPTDVCPATPTPSQFCVPGLTDPATGTQWLQWPIVISPPSGSTSTSTTSPPVSVNPTVNVTVPVSIDFPDSSGDQPEPVPPEPAAGEPTAKTGCLTLDDPLTICTSLAGVGASGGVQPVGAPGSTNTGQMWTGEEGWYNLFNWVTGDAGLAGDAAKALKNAWDWGIKLADHLFVGKSAQCFCDMTTWKESAVRLAYARKAGELAGVDVEYLYQDVEYLQKYSCPQYIPEQGGLDKLYVSGAITREQWECYTKCHGNLPHLAGILAEDERSRPGFGDVEKLYRLGTIDRHEYDHRTRELGYMQPQDLQRASQSFDQLPSVGEIVEWMTRDVTDTEVVEHNDLDSEFDQKYTEQLKKYANAQGITDEQMRWNWRAHWQSVSPRDLFTMLHQLRPGAVSPELSITQSQVKDQLLINDVTPSMVDRMIAISYSVPTRVDLKRGYFIDSIDRERLVAGLLDVGYNPDDAEALAAVFDDEKMLYLQGEAQRYSPWTPKTALRAYAAGELSENDTVVVLIDLKVPDDKIEPMLGNAGREAGAIAKRKCIAGVRHRYMIGEVDEDGAASLLDGYDLDADQVQRLQGQWQCERQSRAKEVNAQKNVVWLKKGLITEEELSRRLDNLGFLPDDVAAFLSEALQDVQAAKAKAAEAAAKAQAKAELAERKRRAPKTKRSKSDAKAKKSTLPDGTVETITDTTTVSQDLTPPIN